MIRRNLLLTAVGLIAYIFELSGPAHAINTGGDFANRSAFRPANVNQRIITRNQQYDYSPTIMLDVDGKYKMWYCGSVSTAQNVGGDNIMYTESTNLASGWSTPISVFKGQQYTGGSGTAFDGKNTCDPTVVRVNGVYYMYYGGSYDSPNILNLTGVAQSNNGTTWTRLNGGNPLAVLAPIDPAKTFGQGFYGVGQPSVVYLDGWFYLHFNDDTAGSTTASKGYLIRSMDPTFPNNAQTEALLVVNNQVGFYPVTMRTTTNRYVTYNVANGDFMYHPGLNRFTITLSGIVGEQNVLFYKKDFLPPGSDYTVPANILGFTDVPGAWREGPAIVRSPFGHAAFYGLNYHASQCVVPLDVIRSITNDTANPNDATKWDLSWSGMNVTFNTACGAAFLKTNFDRDGDHVSDPIVFRPSEAKFYQRKSTLAPNSVSLGNSSSTPVHGDFDGDGIDDVGVVNLVSGFYNWSIVKSTNGQVRNVATWGISGDQVAVADYDNDGKDDVAVYRPSTGTWWIIYESGSQQTLYGGDSGVNVRADFDRDGVADRVAWVPNTGLWKLHFSSGGFVYAVNWGLSGDVPFSGDFSGDGYDDYVVWRPSNGTWYVKAYQGEVTDEIVQWGLRADS